MLRARACLARGEKSPQPLTLRKRLEQPFGNALSELAFNSVSCRFLDHSKNETGRLFRLFIRFLVHLFLIPVFIFLSRI